MCLWLQQHPRPEIEVGLTVGALSGLVRDLGMLMDHSDLDSKADREHDVEG